ncbi:hypothetical protein DRH14_04435 [Candidatus Shapirobacteria bacterium]|nr:MAG: hypothetical protein DRH14_04435 [Candidatus Shapirobacteria bacterium]
MKFTSEYIKKAWIIRRKAAEDWECGVMEISWKHCLEMAGEKKEKATKEGSKIYTHNRTVMTQPILDLDNVYFSAAAWGVPANSFNGFWFVVSRPAPGDENVTTAMLDAVRKHRTAAENLQKEERKEEKKVVLNFKKTTNQPCPRGHTWCCGDCK